jgi:hypothetical protein
MKPVLYLALLSVLWPLGGGWKKYHMTNDPSQPAAVGTLNVRRDKNNGNTELKLGVEHLADPARLTPPASVYVVWVQPREGEPQKEGQIRVDKNFSGDMDATSTVRDGDLFITPESTEAVTTPAGIQALHTHFSD